MTISSRLTTGTKTPSIWTAAHNGRSAAQLSRGVTGFRALGLLQFRLQPIDVQHLPSPKTKNRPTGRFVSLLWRVHLEKQKSPDYRSVFCFFDFLNRRAFMIWLLVRMNSLYDKPVFVTCQPITSNELCRANCTRRSTMKDLNRQVAKKERIEAYLVPTLFYLRLCVEAICFLPSPMERGRRT
jgi:hypothetical protein